MEIGLVDLFDGTEARGLDFMAEFAQTAEKNGFSGLWLPEHIMFFEEYTSAYPYPNHPSAEDPDKIEAHNKTVDGTPQVEAAEDQGLLDVQLAAAELCRATTTLRVGSSVMLLPLRNVSLLARELMTLAELTGDRFDLGVGVGWSQQEVEGCEAVFKTRGRRNEDSMVALAQMWDDDVFPDRSHPLPRVLVGGHSPVAIRRAATVATGWYPYNLTMPEFAEHHATYCRLLEEAGRDRAQQHVVAGVRFTGSLSSLRSLVDRYADIGADGVNISLRMTNDDYAETMAEVAGVLGLAA